MKTNLLILLIVGMLCISSTVITSNIVQPAKPKAIFTDWYKLESSLLKDIKEKHNQGYIVHSITSAGSSGYYILVMEKY